MKRILILSLAASLLASCAGVGPFSQKKYGHLKWIKKGAQTEQSVAKEETGANTNKEAVATVHDAEEKQVTTPAPNHQKTVVEDAQLAPVNETPANTTSKTAEVKSSKWPLTLPAIGTSNATAKVKAKKQQRKPAMDDDVRVILAIIFAFLLPPVGVYLMRETSSPFVLTLVLCLLAILVPVFWFWYGGGLLWLIAVIVALLAVLQDI